MIAPHAGADSEACSRCRSSIRCGKRVVIFRGVGGRELLRENGSNARGAPGYADFIGACDPRPTSAFLLGAWDRGEVDALVATISEGLRNLL